MKILLNRLQFGAFLFGAIMLLTSLDGVRKTNGTGPSLIAGCILCSGALIGLSITNREG